MKKIILLLSIISFVLTSCNSDDLTTTATNDNEKYPISFKIAAPITVEGNTYKSTTTKPSFFNSIEMRIYNEAGDQLMTFYYTKLYNKEAFNNDTAHIELALPKGVYNIGVYTMLSTREIGYSSWGSAVDEQSKLHNYFSYSYPYEGTYTYYESITTTVAPTNQIVEREISLKPLWSNLNITLNDAQTFSVPEGTDALQFVVSPLYTGFHLSTKLSTNKMSENWVSTYSEYKTNIISLDQIRANATFTYPTYVYQTLPENGNLAIKLNYLQTKNTTDTIVLKTRELQIPDITIENGYNYNIKGNLDAVNNNQSMNISLGEFNKEAVEINF